jgi:hypothetical protein
LPRLDGIAEMNLSFNNLAPHSERQWRGVARLYLSR